MFLAVQAVRAAGDTAPDVRVIAPGVVTSLEQIWAMTEVEARQWHRLKMEYTVYYYDPLWKAMWGRCGEAENYLSLGSKPFPIKAGQRILVEGLILPANGMTVDEPEVTVLAESVPIEVLSTRGQVANTERFDKRMVTVEGLVDNQTASDSNHHELSIVVEGQSMLAIFIVHNGEPVPQFKGSFVRARGVYFARNEPTWPAPKLEMWVPGVQDLEILHSIDRDERFRIPVIRIDELSGVDPDQVVRVVGEVQSLEPGRSMTLKDESGRITFPVAQTQLMPAGSRVDVIGFPRRQGGEWTLSQTLYRSARKILRKFEDVTDVSEKERNDVYQLSMETTVYFFDPLWRVMWGRCEGMDGYISFGEQDIAIRPGQKILIEGLLVPAKGMNVDEPRIRVLADSVPLEVLPTRGQIGDTGRFDKKIVTIEGYADRQEQPDSRHLQINLITEGRAVTLQIPIRAGSLVPDYKNSLLLVRGVYSSTYDPANVLPKIEVWIQEMKDVEIRGSLDEDPRFNLPLTSIDKLATAPPGKLVRTVGAVRAQQPGRSLTIRDGMGQVSLQTAQSQPVQIGEQVEAIGYPVLEGMEWQLRDSLYRHPGFAPEQTAQAKRTFHLADELRELPADMIARGASVELTGVVTWENPAADFFFMSDSSGGVCVYQPSPRNPLVARGAKIIVSGVTARGKFAPVVLASAVWTFARIDLPEPKQVILEQAMTGIEEAQWITMSGYVRSVAQEGPWARLELTTSGGEFVARLPWKNQLMQLQHSVVRLRGVCSALTNDKRQLTGIQLWVNDEQFLEIEEAEPADPFTVAVQSIASLRQFGPLQTANRRVRLAGVVVHHQPGHLLHIQEGSEGLLVLSRNLTPLTPGDRVEVVGFPGREGQRVVLREAIFRRVSAGAEPEPKIITELEPIDVELDGRLVNLKAEILDVEGRGDRDRIILQADKVIFEAQLDAEKRDAATEWIVGSKVALTGVYQVQLDEYKRPHAVRLQLRSAQDVQVLSRPSWWTAGRALAVTGVLAVGLMLGFGWVLALRRRVSQQTGQIREQGESEKAARLEAALARASKLESLGVLAGGIAHDFNNLLTVVMGNLSLAKLDPRIEPDTVECLHQGERAAQRARDLTQQLITFAKGGEPVREVTVLSAVLREATQFALHGSKVRCDYDLSPDAWLADVDKGQIGQVVHNIIINATHAMPEGGVIKITLRNEAVAAGFRTALSPGHYLRLTISDTGTGIAPELLTRIFDPYFTTKSKGSGLGLATVYSIVKKHGGHLEVASKLGKGTTFSIWLPAQAVASDVVKPAPSADLPPRVLFMDDELAIRLLGTGIFKRMGLDCTAVAGGVEVLTAYAEGQAEGRPYDLVMLDLTVPGGMGGAEAMLRLRQVDPGVKAIVSSGYSNDPILANYREHGFCARVSKPYDITDFIKTISDLLPGRVKMRWGQVAPDI